MSSHRRAFLVKTNDIPHNNLINKLIQANELIRYDETFRATASLRINQLFRSQIRIKLTE